MFCCSLRQVEVIKMILGSRWSFTFWLRFDWWYCFFFSQGTDKDRWRCRIWCVIIITTQLPIIEKTWVHLTLCNSDMKGIGPVIFGEIFLYAYKVSNVKTEDMHVCLTHVKMRWNKTCLNMIALQQWEVFGEWVKTHTLCGRDWRSNILVLLEPHSRQANSNYTWDGAVNYWVTSHTFYKWGK